MRVAGGGLHLRVTQELAVHRQAFPERERPRGEGVAEMVAGVVIGVARTAVTRAQECQLRRSG